MNKKIIKTLVIAFAVILTIGGSMQLSSCSSSSSSSAAKPSITLDNGTKKLTFNASSGFVADKLEKTTLKSGSGEEVKPNATVTVKYTGWLPDGTQFDSNWDKDEISFSLNQVIKGWGEGLVGCKVGEIVQLIIPAELGYGSQSAGQIPANSTLIFAVEILATK